MAKKRTFYYESYPPTEDTRTGCKVGWRTYATREEAEACSKAARHNAAIQAGFGYDFGYCAPGSITKLDNGHFEVCIP